MIGQKLVVVGGVWMHSDGVPGVVMIDLATRSSVEFSLDTVSSQLKEEANSQDHPLVAGSGIGHKPCLLHVSRRDMNQSKQ